MIGAGFRVIRIMPHQLKQSHQSGLDGKPCYNRITKSVTTQEHGSRAASLSSDEDHSAELLCTCGIQTVESKFHCQNHQLEREHLPK